MDKIKVFKTSMRIIIEDESCDILENANLLLERIKEDYLASSALVSGAKSVEPVIGSSRRQVSSLGVEKAGDRAHKARTKTSAVTTGPTTRKVEAIADATASASTTTTEHIRSICDQVIKDSIRSCREPDYKMELAKLLSGEAKIELYIEHGKLSNAQRLACNMNRPDYVSSIIEEAAKLNQNHIKTVCQLWLAKH